MLARDWIIILVLFGLVSGVGYLVVVDIASSESGYNVVNMTDENYQSRYDTLTESSRNIYQMQTEAKSEEGLSVISAFTTFFSSTFGIIGIIFGSFGLATTTMANFGQDLGMSGGLSNLVFGAILVMIISTIVFIIVSSVSRGRL